MKNQPQTKILVFTLATLCLTAPVALAQAPLDIEGVQDQSWDRYTGSASFRVPSQAGYSYQVLLNGDPAPADQWVELTKPDYYELRVWRTNDLTSTVTNRLVRFIIRAPGRGDTENGLPPWTPYPTIPSTAGEFAGARLRLLTPSVYPVGYEIPVVAWVENAEGHAVRANGWLTDDGHPSILVRRGVGSGHLAASHPPGPLPYNPQLPGLQTNRTIQLEETTTWTNVFGALNGNTVWPDNSRISVIADVDIPPSSTLTIGQGTVVLLRNLVDITNRGHIVINGTLENPVVFAPFNRSQPWGGFFMMVSTSEFDATGAIFTGACALQSGFAGHKSQQCLFYMDNHSRLTLTDCAAIDLAGQFGHAFGKGAPNYLITLTRTLLQRAVTGGEYTDANFTVNDCAFLDFPADTASFDQFEDGDQDALYLVSGTHAFTNTLFGWTKDDGIDSGGGGSGTFNYQDCWFEAIYHEGNSLSGTGKQIFHTETVFIGCGQGLEAGYSGPAGHMIHCLALNNLVGGRFGDNYRYPSYSYSGSLSAVDSILLHNYHDIWGVNFQDWDYRVSAMDVHDNLFTVPNPYHPNNQVWAPAADAPRLAPFMTTPPAAPVGIGLAIRQEQFDLNEIIDGIPVGLSTFTTNVVTVDYAAQTGAGTILAQGTFALEPGWTIKPLQLDIPNLQEQGMIRVSLSNPTHGELTGIQHCYLVRTPQAPSGTETTLIARRSDWNYHNLNTPLPIAWRGQGYDDSGWPGSGPGPLGNNVNSGVQQCTTVIDIGPSGSRYPTVYFRRTFEVADPSAFGTLRIGLQRDDGGVVYINGQEIYRDSNVPVGQTHTTWTNGDTPSESEYASGESSASMLQAGQNVIAAEIHQGDANSSDLAFDLELFGSPGTETPIYVGMFDGEVVLGWGDPDYRLEEAPAVTGPWNPSGAPSPVVVDPSQPQRFYRLHKP